MELICYLSNGYPTIASSIEMAQHYVAAGCDVIEIDFPAHDPYLESPYLADRMHKALDACGDYKAYMDGMAEAKRLLPDTNFLLLAYEDTITEIGLETFLDFCKENAFEDMILVGLKHPEIKEKIIESGIKVSCYIQFQMPQEEVEAAKNSNGFVYMQGKPTEGMIHPEYPTLKDCIARLRAEGITRPIYCGVGIHTPEDAKMAKEAGADGIFIGSAILKLQEDLPAMSQKIRDFKAEC